GIFLVMNLLRESRLQLQPLGGATGTIFDTYVSRFHNSRGEQSSTSENSSSGDTGGDLTAWKRWKGRFWSRPS
ncbi:hypothetical protein FRC07_012349, partial [Ceratobasidium sp. 392]